MTKHRYCTRCGTLAKRDQPCPRCNHPHGRSLATHHHQQAWLRLQRLALQAHPSCQRCGATRDLTVHHLTYPARTLHDVEVQCRPCHAATTAKGG